MSDAALLSGIVVLVALALAASLLILSEVRRGRFRWGRRRSDGRQKVQQKVRAHVTELEQVRRLKRSLMSSGGSSGGKSSSG